MKTLTYRRRRPLSDHSPVGDGDQCGQSRPSQSLSFSDFSTPNGYGYNKYSNLALGIGRSTKAAAGGGVDSADGDGPDDDAVDGVFTVPKFENLSFSLRRWASQLLERADESERAHLRAELDSGLHELSHRLCPGPVN